MTRAHIGADDLQFFQSPRPELLREIFGIEPTGTGDHVRLDKHTRTRIRSTQRIALGDVGGEIVVGLWPAELKPQADFLYREGRALEMIAAARELGWEVWPSPQVAFHTAPPARRLYLHPEITAEEYARRWQGSDGRWIGQHSAEDVRRGLWPWLKRRGYATDEDDETLERFLAILGNRPAHLRPGLRIRKRWTLADASPSPVVAEIREHLNALLAAAGDARLPGWRGPTDPSSQSRQGAEVTELPAADRGT